MMIAIYACKVVICSALMYSYYYFFLRNRQFHQYNRYYLLAGVVFSCLFPLIRMPLLHNGNKTDTSFIQSLSVISTDHWENAIVLMAHKNSSYSFLNTTNTALALYLAGFTVCSFYITRSLLYIRKLRRTHSKEKSGSIQVYQTAEPGTPFSFFHSLFWNKKINISSDKGQQILRHELFHIRAGHSYDLMFMRCITTLFWFNPFFYLFARETKTIHEFLADGYASSSVNRYDYAELLVTEAISSRNSLLFTQFFHHQIKRRIAMLIQQHPTNFSYTRRIMALPLLFILFCSFALKSGGYSSIGTYFLPNFNPITVLIDAGHGGPDAGAHGISHMTEKELTLSIAQKIKELGSNYNVNVILTREEDVLPGNTSNIQEGLVNRMSILQNKKADLFISVHVNTDNASGSSSVRNGFDIYISGQNKLYTKSRLLGSAIIGEIRNTTRISDVLKESKSIYVLQHSSVPAVLIECGYMTNKTDMDFIADKQNQEKIATDILKGIVGYQRNVTVAYNQRTEQKIIDDTIPASELIELLQQNKMDKSWMDSKANTFRATLKNGDTVLTSLSEFMKLSHDRFDHYPGKSADSSRAQTEAEYPGGPTAWARYLNKNFSYPIEAQRHEIQGKIILQFTVDADGKVSNVNVISGTKEGGLREEAVRLIQNSGPWLPIVQDGHPVASIKKQPVIFRLDTE